MCCRRGSPSSSGPSARPKDWPSDGPLSAAPSVIASPQTDVRSKQLQQAQVEMGDATEFARRYWIPVLNQNRFLSLIGFVRPT